MPRVPHASAGRPQSLPGQAPVTSRAPDSAQLPRFTLRQIVVGRNDSIGRLPGPWVGSSWVVADGFGNAAASASTSAYPKACWSSDLRAPGYRLLIPRGDFHCQGRFP